VGRDSLIGALGRTFGYARLPNVLGQLSAGTLFVVIDALDEARSKAGEAAIMDFLDDVGKTAKSAPGVAFVLLGRTGTAEDSWLILSDIGVRTCLCRIDFFDEAKRIRYLDQRLKRNPKTAGYIKAHQTAFDTARDLLFSQLGKAIDPAGGHQETREAAAFLGYAPVLDAIAVLLGEEDYFGLVNKLRDAERRPEAKTGFGRMRLLKAVVERILEREQEKMIKILKPDLAKQAPPGWTAWQELYTPAEQRARLLARILNDPWTGPVNVPAELRRPYEERIQSFFGEHAFLKEAKHAASIVFEAYLFADALIAPTHPLREELAAFIERRHILPSGLLADFYFFFRDAASQPIPLTHVGLLYGSFLSAETESRRLHLDLDAGDPEPDELDETKPTVEFEWVDPTADDPEAADLGVLAAPVSVGARDRLTFRLVLKDASITVPSTARLETQISEFVIGPEVQIKAKCLEISNPETLVVKGATNRPRVVVDEQLVVLEALSAEVASLRKVTCYGVLSVNWPGCRAYPWTPYATEAAQDVTKDPRLALVYRRFRRIAMAFRSQKKGQLARIKYKIESPRMLKGALGQALLESMLADRLLYISGKLYFWDRDVANDLVGISWHDLRRGLTPPKLIGYLRRFAEQHQDLLKRA
jgi:hypothetical protein